MRIQCLRLRDLALFACLVPAVSFVLNGNAIGESAPRPSVAKKTGPLVETLATPAPTRAAQLRDEDQEAVAKYKLEEERTKLKQMMAPYDPSFEPSLQEIPISEEEQRKLYGDPVEYYEVPFQDRIEGCMYTPGYTDPSYCFDKNNKVIYKFGSDKKILEQLKAEHKFKREMLLKYYRALETQQ